MEKAKKKGQVMGVIGICLAVLYLIGTFSFLAPCGPMEDGTHMHCHMAGQALSGIAAAVLILTVVQFFVQKRAVQLTASILIIVLALLMFLVPGTFVELCMMNTMRCQAVMKPGAFVFAVIFIVWTIFHDLLKREK